jgi:hypothetical protein
LLVVTGEYKKEIDIYTVQCRAYGRRSRIFGRLGGQKKNILAPEAEPLEIAGTFMAGIVGFEKDLLASALVGDPGKLACSKGTVPDTPTGREGIAPEETCPDGSVV